MIITIQFEIDDQTPVLNNETTTIEESLHEALCLAIHEEDKKAMEFSSYNILKNYLNTLDLLQQPDDQPQSHLSNCPISSQKEYCGKFSGHKLYYWAADTVSEKQLGHWGIHVNHHIAKLFADKYMEIKND